MTAGNLAIRDRERAAPTPPSSNGSTESTSTDVESSSGGPSRTRALWQRIGPGTRWSGGALLGFLLARLLNLLEFIQVAPQNKDKSLGSVLVRWDGEWYLRIAHQGYPTVLEHDLEGRLRQSPLAFFPVYPGLIGGLARLTGLPYGAVAVGLSLLFGSFAAVGIVWLLRPRLGGAGALTASLIWSSWVSAPVLAMAYSESLFCAEIVAILLLVTQRRYGWLAVVVPVAALTRGSFPPVIVVLAVHLLHVLLTTERGRRLRASLWPLAVLVWSTLCTLAWPVFVGRRIGQADAYLQIQHAWKHDFSPLHSWGTAIGRFGTRPGGGLMNDLVLLVVLAAIVLAIGGLFTDLEPELKVLAPVALLYLMAVLDPTTSFLRFMLPLVTLPAVLAVWLRSLAARIGIIVLLTATQFWWVHQFLVSTPAWHPTP